MTVTIDKFISLRIKALLVIVAVDPGGPIGGTPAMFMTNPFAELSASIPPAAMQAYLLVMILLVASGTLLDIGMKKSATYFFNHWRNAQRRGVRQVGGAQMTV